MVGFRNPFRSVRDQKRRADSLYHGLMAAALAPEPYAAGIVPDDMDHRVQMVALHASILVWQLARRPEKVLQRLPKLIHTRVFDGFDASFRETGVGDASIARKVRKLGEHYYGLGSATASCLSGVEAQRLTVLSELLKRNGVTAAGCEVVLAKHLMALAIALEAVPSEAFLSGTLAWPVFKTTSIPGVAKV